MLLQKDLQVILSEKAKHYVSHDSFPVKVFIDGIMDKDFFFWKNTEETVTFH